MIVHAFEQRTDEWTAIKLGKFSSSIMGDLMPTAKQKPDDWNKTQLGIIYRVAAERMTGEAKVEKWDTPSVARGRELEDEARVAYMMETGRSVVQVGFIEPDAYDPLYGWFGCSPDGLGTNGLSGLEIKCPDSSTHLKYRLDPCELRIDYGMQCFAPMLCSLAIDHWSLYSYDSRFRDTSKQSVLVEIERDSEIIDAMRERLYAAIAKAKELME